MGTALLLEVGTEPPRIGIFGSQLSYAGSSGRVTSEPLGRDLNPLGRGDGYGYIAGALAILSLHPLNYIALALIVVWLAYNYYNYLRSAEDEFILKYGKEWYGCIKRCLYNQFGVHPWDNIGWFWLFTALGALNYPKFYYANIIAPIFLGGAGYLFPAPNPFEDWDNPTYPGYHTM